MGLTCALCRTEASDGDRESGRCGNCGSFYSNASLAVESKPVAPEAEAISSPDAERIVDTSSLQEARLSDNAGTDLSSLVEGTMPGAAGSEELVKPRKLSPQFERHIERAWQGTLASVPQGFQQTLNNKSETKETKQQHGTSLSIGRRRINKRHDKGQGDYELKKLIGKGAMGQVWGARQASLDRDVAIKIPNPEIAAAGSLGESQFISEVVVTGKLEHPNIVPIYELGRDANGRPFYSMKHVQGKPWNEAIYEKNEQENIEVLMKVCDALAFAHSHDFLHRDIKPENVIVGEFGEVAVMDWGIAISLSEDPNRSWAALASGPAGTPAYMAPEMAAHNSSELGVVSDVYLLGAVLYEIVTGTPPHPQTAGTRDALFAAASNLIVSTDQIGELVDIARKAMATDVRDRYQTVSDFQNALRLHQSHHESVKLTKSAESHLGSAEQDRNSDEYARARFAFEEAIKLWPENRTARIGLDQATLAYATHALRENDFSLGLSILDEHNESHQPVFAKLKAGQRSQRRQAVQIRVLVRSVVAMIAVTMVAGVFFYIRLLNEKTRAESLRSTADELKTKAEKAKTTAENAQTIAEEAKTKAEDAKTKAEDAKAKAEAAKRNAEIAKLEAEHDAYRALIGFSNQAIQRNDFGSATKAINIGKESIPDNIRHWEWGRIQYLLEDSFLRSFPELDTTERVQCMAIEKLKSTSADTPSPASLEVIAAGTSSGLRLWTISSEEFNNASEPVLVGHFLKNQSVNALTITKCGDRLITGYTATNGQERLAVWNLKVDMDNRLQVSNPGPNEILEVSWGKTTSLATANTAGQEIVLSSGQDNQRQDNQRQDNQGQDNQRQDNQGQYKQGQVKLFRLKDTKLTALSDLSAPISHRETVWSINVWTNDDESDSEQLLTKIATASEDGSVSVWQTSDWKNIEQVAKFTGHRGPVYTAVFADENQIASGGNDRKIILWHPLNTEADFQKALRKGVEKAIGPKGGKTQTNVYRSRVIGYHDASIHCLATIRDNAKKRTTIFSGSNDNSIRIWDAPDKKSAQFTKALRGHGQWVTACLLTSDKKMLLSGAFDGIKKWQWEQDQNPIVFADGLSTDLGSQSIELSAIGVEHAACSPDGQWIVAARSDGRINFWDTNMQRGGGSHEFLPNSVMFYQNGSRIMTSAGDNSTRMWDVDNQTQITSLLGTGLKGVAVISEAGNLCLTGSDDPEKRARAWSKNKEDDSWKAVDTFDEMLRRANNMLKGANESKGLDSITSIALSSDARFGLLCDKQGNCLLFSINKNTRQCELVNLIATGQSEITNSAFHPHEPVFFTGNFNGRITKWKFDDGPTSNMREVEFRMVNGPIKALAVSTDGQKVLVGFNPPIRRTQLGKQDSPSRETAYLLDAKNLRTLNNLKTSEDLPQLKSLVFSDSGDSALVLAVPTDASINSLIGLWTFDTDEFQAFPSTGFGDTVNIAVPRVSTPDQVSKFLTFSNRGIALWDRGEIEKTKAETQEVAPVAVFKKSDKAIFAAFDSSSRQACTVDGEGRLILWNLGKTKWQQAKVVPPVDSKIIAANFSIDNAQQLFTLEQHLGDEKSGLIREWTSKDGEWSRKSILVRLTSRPKCFKLVANEESRRQFIVGHGTGFEIWQYRDGSSTSIRHVLTKEVTAGVDCLAFSANGNRLVTASGMKACIWSIANEIASEPQELTEEAAKIRAVDISEDGHRVLTGGEDFMTKLWEVKGRGNRSNEEMRIPVMNLTPHTRSVTTVMFSKAGNEVITAGEDGRIILEKSINMLVAINDEKFVDITENTFTSLAGNASIETPTNYSFDKATLAITSNVPADRMTVRITPSSASAKEWHVEQVEGVSHITNDSNASSDNQSFIIIRPNKTTRPISPTLSSLQNLIRDIQIKTSSIQNGSLNENSSEIQISIQLHDLFANDATASANERASTSSLPLKIQVNVNSPSEED